MTKLRLILILTGLFSVFGVGWMSRGWYEDSQDKRAVESLAKDNEKANQRSEIKAQELSKAAAIKRKVIENEHAELQDEIRTADGLRCLSPAAAELHHRIVETLSDSHTGRVGCDQ